MDELPKKFGLKIKDGVVSATIDTNQDGENLVEANIYLDEAAQELFQRGEKVEGQGLYKFTLDPLKGLMIELDTDKDGQKCGDFKLNLFEGVDEAGLLKS